MENSLESWLPVDNSCGGNYLGRRETPQERLSAGRGPCKPAPLCNRPGVDLPALQFSPFPLEQPSPSDRPGARRARRSEPLRARTDLESFTEKGKGVEGDLSSGALAPVSVVY